MPKTKSKKTSKELKNENLSCEDGVCAVAQPSEEPEKKKRHVPTRESVDQEFEELQRSIEEEIDRLREDDSSKSKGVKFLRSVNKRLKTLRSHTNRVTKQRKNTGRKNNSNSGFLKPVRISRSLAKFTGWDPSEMKSRVDVTKYICNYIKEHDLQNPEDRRQICVEKDSRLSKLLDYDPDADDKPLTYYSLQRYLKKHFLPDDAPQEPEKKSRKKKSSRKGK